MSNQQPAATSDNPTETIVRVVVMPVQAAATASPLLTAAHELGVTGLGGVVAGRIYDMMGTLDEAAVARLAAELMADPVTERWEASVLGSETAALAPDQGHRIDVAYLPGVTDPAAQNLVRAAHDLGVGGLRQAATGRRYELSGALSPADLHQLAAGLLANPVIQRFAIDGPLPSPFVAHTPAGGRVETIPLRELDGDALLAVSLERRLALDLAEMTAIRDQFRREGREPTDVELEMLAQTWSEHCVHKTFRALIDYDGPPPGVNAAAPPVAQTIDGLLRSLIRAATEQIDKPWVRSAFVDNAGIVAFDDTYDLAFKVETHNHPSALEPFGGANTGVGGVVRDVLGVSARPIANTDVLCFGPPDTDPDDLPEGVLHPQRIADGVIAGIEDYGNKMGIPTVNGAIPLPPRLHRQPAGLLRLPGHFAARQPSD